MFISLCSLPVLLSFIEILGTPLGDGTALVVGGKDLLPKAVPPTALEMTRMIATCRVVLPATMVRLSAGRMGFSQGEQTLMFLAGANSIFYGEQLLTTANPEVSNSSTSRPHLHMASERAVLWELVPFEDLIYLSLPLSLRRLTKIGNFSQLLG